MVEEVYPGIYRIRVVLPDNPLRELNSYFIRGRERDVLIDTGFRRDACRESLEAGLSELGSDQERRDVLLTHMHSDHCGMADLFVGKDRRIFAGDREWTYFFKTLQKTFAQESEKRFLEEGFSIEQLKELERTNPALTEGMKDPDEKKIRTLRAGEILRIGDLALETLLVGGHTPGNCMFYLREQKIMFTGDHILFDITPNITWWPWVEDSLGNYIGQLQRVRNMPVALALPGHRLTGVYRDRIDALLLHHKNRIEEARQIAENTPDLCAYEIASKMHWKIKARDWPSFPLIQKWFAVGECMAHLDYLVKRNRMEYRTVDGIRRYKASGTIKNIKK